MFVNAAAARWRSGAPSLGTYLTLANPHLAESLAVLGFDFVFVDLQHGLIDAGDLPLLLPALDGGETTAIVRVPGLAPDVIMRVLDAGAAGVVVPLVNTAAEARQAVEACRYPPEGRRSFGPIRAALRGGAGYVKAANAEVSCIVMIETREGLENIEEIVATPGLGAVYVGPHDLAFALGVPPEGAASDPVHRAAVSRILQTARRAGLPAGIHTSRPDMARDRLAEGFNFATLASDWHFFARAAARDLSQAREGLVARDPPGPAAALRGALQAY